MKTRCKLLILVIMVVVMVGFIGLTAWSNYNYQSKVKELYEQMR